MISFNSKTLTNGLKVTCHTDPTAQVSAVSVLYKVGSRDELPHQTGMAHLFEHLMFSGSLHAKNYDRPLQKAGGENNAFTNNDFTNYYGVVPTINLDTLFWLESDRMSDLILTDKKIKNQKSVVIEEFKETCLNEPYGDVWHHISGMAYQVHPYQWPVIGAEVEHIKNVNHDDALNFYRKFYQPSNAIICISGPQSSNFIFESVEKWFGDIPNKYISPTKKYDQEPLQIFQRRKIVAGNVPANALYMAFPAYARDEQYFYASDLISDILSSGRSARLYRNLVKENQIFTYIDAYITGTFDKGLFVIEGKLSPDVSLEKAENAVWSELHKLIENGINEHELQKIKNKAESALVFSELGIMHRTINLSFFEALGNPNLINEEASLYQNVTLDYIMACAKEMFAIEKSNILWYTKS
jgi:zinc protease